MCLTSGELNKNSSLELKQVLVIVFKIKTTCRGVITITYCLFITFLDFTEERDHNDAPLTRIAQSVKSFIPYKVCWDQFMQSSKVECSIVLCYCQIYIFGMETGHLAIPTFNFKIFSKFTDVWQHFKSFGNSLGNSYIQLLLIIIQLHFTCGERKICVKA